MLKKQYPDAGSNDPKVQKTTLGTTSRLQEIAKVPRVQVINEVAKVPRIKRKSGSDDQEKQ